MENRLLIDVTRISPGGDDIEGEVDVVGLTEDLAKSFGGVRYRLHVELFGTELLVRGTLEQDFDLVCSRCGKDFDTTVTIDDFTASFQVDVKNPEMDISDELRESVLLELPTYPICDENCEGIAQKAARPAESRWDALDALKIS